MMRKILLLIVILFSSLNIYSLHVGVIPYTGSFGVNMASSNYQGSKAGFDSVRGTTTSNKDDSPPWVDSTISAFSNGTYDSKNYYCDDHMIATGGVYEVPESQNGSNMYITVNCSSGFYFTSVSNPNSIRPFELIIVPRYHSGNEGPISYSDTVHTGEAIIIDNSKNNVPIPIPYNFRDGNIYVSNGTPNPRIWFDLVLVLPLSANPIPNSNYIEAYNRRYPLIPADDYSAIVTVKVEWNGLIQSIVIPFSGFYTGTVSGTDKNDESVSLRVATTSAAANLDIQQHAKTPITIANIDFMYDVTSGDYDESLIPGRWKEQTFSFDDYVKIFLSSSNNPEEVDPDEFRLINDNARKSGSVLTNFNSIGFEIIARGEEGNINNNTDTGWNPPGAVYKARTFQGNDSITKGLSEAIVPVRNVNESTHFEGAREYFTYKGSLDVVIDEPPEAMNPGAYTGVVYVHVVSDETKREKQPNRV